ncbi:MAG: hypothetical protein H3C25_08965 [Candidatus Brocadia sapporoensis]|nr:hypothetical protein [Candidatus Brocadia sapporoensis]QQR67872.1 MAG: hypothetical protein IPI25_06715 [Candidatus Brocadia sp.]
MLNNNQLEAKYIALAIRYEYAIPAEAGVQRNTGFLVDPGKAGRCKVIPLCIVRGETL